MPHYGETDFQVTDEIHAAACEYLIGAMLYAPQEHVRLVRLSMSSKLMDIRLIDTYNAIIVLEESGQPVTPEMVAAQGGADVDMLYNYKLAAKNLKDSEVDQYLKLVVDRGKEIETKRVGHKLASGFITRLQAQEELVAIESYGRDVRDTSAAGIAAMLEEEWAYPAPTGAVTGIDRLDRWLWSMPRGENTLVVGPYKGGKSRLKRNLVLAVAMRKTPVAVGITEGDVIGYGCDCIAMIANQWLIETGQFNPIANSDYGALSGNMIRYTRLWKSQPTLKRAVAIATSIWQGLPLVIFDKRDLANVPEELYSKFWRQYINNGTWLVAVDYIQQMRFPGSGIYERMTGAQDWVADITNHMHALILSQQSEEGIKRGHSHSPSAKGGGDLPAQANTIFTLKYGDDNDDLKVDSNYGNMEVTLALGRSAGSNQVETFRIENESGLMHSVIGGQRIYITPIETLEGGQQELIPQEDDMVLP